jgi:nitrate/nitrite-specific signal transduction histidine kinase
MVKREEGHLFDRQQANQFAMSIDRYRNQVTAGHVVPKIILIDMRERALLTGGQVRVVSRPGAGTRVLAEWPLQAG